MIEDKELDELAKTSEITPVVVKPDEVSNVPAVDNEDKVKIQTQFSKAMDTVKENVLQEASQNDEKFVNTIKENVKAAATKLTEVEKNKADFQQQQVQYESEKLGTKQRKNIHEQNEDTWLNKQKRRQFHYDGVKPIMEFVGIKEPMNLAFLYLLAVILTPLFLVAKFIKGTFGTLVAGASDEKRSKAAKGFLWTMLCIFTLLVVICLVYLFLKWQGIDILANIKR